MKQLLTVSMSAITFLLILLSCATTPQDDNPPTSDDISGATTDETSDVATADAASAADATDTSDADVVTDTETATEEGVDDDASASIATSFLARYEIKDMSEINEVAITPEGGSTKNQLSHLKSFKIRFNPS